MGANWYDLNVHFGIPFCKSKLRKLLRGLKKKEITLGKYKCYLVETTTHSRTEYDDWSDTLDRCDAFIGFQCDKMVVDDIHGFLVEFKDFLKKNKSKLTEYGIVDCSPCIIGGIEHDPDSFDDSDNESSDGGSQPKRSKHDDESDGSD